MKSDTIQRHFSGSTFGCLALVISLQFVASGLAAQTADSGKELREVCAGIDNSYECAQAIERHQLQKPRYAGHVTRQGERLYLKLRSGRRVALENSREADDASVTKYSFRDHLQEIGYYLAHCQYYEGNDYLLINERTGKRFKLQETPVVSPDRQRIATASAGLFGCCGPNAVQVWRLTSTGLTLEQTIQPKEWEPSDVEWIDNRTIRLTKNFAPDGEGNRSDGHPVLLKLQKEWSIVEQ